MIDIPTDAKTLKNKYYISLDKRKTKEINRLLVAGISHSVLTIRPFLLLDAIRTISVDQKRGRRMIPRKKQVKFYEKIWQNPLYNSYVLAISSTPNDSRAKLLACLIMQRAIVAQEDQNKQIVMPKWHNVYGGYVDKLRDSAKEENPSLLVLSNITQNCTNMKLEKIRDNLEIFSNIPRIVTLSEKEPLTFFHERLKYPLNSVICLNNRRQIVEI